MTELSDRLAKLTPAQRKLLELRRAQQSTAPAAISQRAAGPVPLSFAQERLWFLDRMEPGNAFYSLPNAVRLGGALDEAALERALGEIVRRRRQGRDEARATGRRMKRTTLRRRRRANACFRVSRRIGGPPSGPRV